MKVEMLEDVRGGDLLVFIDPLWMRKYDHRQGDNAIANGVAARNITKGELIEFDPSDNTADVLVRNRRSGE